MPEIDHYFRYNWKPNYDKFKYSGWQLLDKIDKDAHILEIGCGFNLLKPHFPNLYGIDPCNSDADQEIAFEDYTPHKNFDVFLALGSLNFGDEKVVDKQNKDDSSYESMSPEYDKSIAFKAACELIFHGKSQPSGYTEPLLHLNRLIKKS